MRIRSIKPEFWRSRSISCLSIEDRLLFIGLWSYVDDNGVGLDRLSNIAADLFADDLERDPRETFARVSRGLANLSAGGRIVRYAADGRDLLAVVNWSEHQRIDRPGKERYPLPTTDDASIREDLATPSRDTRDTPATGAGEQGNRGAGEQGTRESRATRARALPAEWLPDPQTVDAIRTELPGVDLATEHRKFTDHFHANGKPMKDWNAAWRNWMRRAKDYSPRPTISTQTRNQDIFDRATQRANQADLIIEGEVA